MVPMRDTVSPKDNSFGINKPAARRISRVSLAETRTFRVPFPHPSPCKSHEFVRKHGFATPRARRCSIDPELVDLITKTTARNEVHLSLFPRKSRASSPSSSMVFVARKQSRPMRFLQARYVNRTNQGNCGAGIIGIAATVSRRKIALSQSGRFASVVSHACSHEERKSTRKIIFPGQGSQIKISRESNKDRRVEWTCYEQTHDCDQSLVL